MRYSAYVLLFPVWVGFAYGVNVYLPWPSCRASKAHRRVSDTQTGKSRTFALYRIGSLEGTADADETMEGVENVNRLAYKTRMKVTDNFDKHHSINRRYEHGWGYCQS